ncbi:sulfurtransferase [Mycobacterium sp. 1165196.3]|uniref:sulfurtransferase n=1 Tax=Mycobacterium sp. 1165196.3 TaxID=1834071 RepID=UPI000A910EAC|nr:rhodanese-like domain-containing protein [Mycobacterium sp. 1165196.3]
MTVNTTFPSHLVAQASDLLSTPSADRCFLDVRLGDPTEEYRDFRKCHIHGALHAQIREVFASRPTEQTGTLPLPDITLLAEQLTGWGIRSDTEVIVYARTPAIAARGWWTLRWAGLTNVRLLDGGLQAWRDAGGAVAEGPAHRHALPRGSLRLHPDNMPTVTAADVEARSPGTIVVDARDEATFVGGHIPKAVNLPAIEQWTPRSDLRALQQIQVLYHNAGISSGSDVIVYCGGGVLSALEVLTLQAATGVTPHLYVGSWSDWIRDPQRRAAAHVEHQIF